MAEESFSSTERKRCSVKARFKGRERAIREVKIPYDAYEARRQRAQLTRPKAETEARFSLCHFAFLGQVTFDRDFEPRFEPR